MEKTCANDGLVKKFQELFEVPQPIDLRCGFLDHDRKFQDMPTLQYHLCGFHDSDEVIPHLHRRWMTGLEVVHFLNYQTIKMLLKTPPYISSDMKSLKANISAESGTVSTGPNSFNGSETYNKVKKKERVCVKKPNKHIRDLMILNIRDHKRDMAKKYCLKHNTRPNIYPNNTPYHEKIPPISHLPFISIEGALVEEFHRWAQKNPLCDYNALNDPPKSR